MWRGLTIALTFTALATWWPAQAAAATAGTRTGWAVQPTPAPPGSEFYDVFCLSATDCTAVGNYEPSTGPVFPLAEHWNGHTWAIEAAPNPAGSYEDVLIAISCAAASDCVAVGQYVNARSNALTLAEHWNGSMWALTAAHDVPGGSSVLVGVSCTAVTRCVAVGNSSQGTSAGGTVTDVWNGSAWTLSRSDPAPQGYFSAISCTGADNCTAVGTALHGTLAASWNGSTWKRQAMPRPARLNSASLAGVSCLTAAGCTAVGSYYTTGGQQDSLAEHYAHGRWQVQATAAPVSGRILESVWCMTAGCTAAGYLNSVTEGPVGTLAERN
jgi:hypothetical protein